MKNVTRKLFIALLVTASSIASSAELSTTGVVVTHPRQGLLSLDAPNAASASNFNIELEAEYVRHDIVQFNYSTTLSQGSVDTLSSQFTCDGLTADSDSVVFGYLDADADLGIVRYRLVRINNGSASADFSTIGLHCVTPVLELDPQALATAGLATLTVQTSSLYGQDIEKAGSVTIANVVDAYTVSVGTPFDEVVDVATDKKSFVGSTVDNSGDSLGLTLTVSGGTAGDLLVKNVFAANTVSAGVATVAPVTSSGIITTITGDFSFLDTNQTTEGMQLGVNTVNVDGHTISFPSDLSSVVATNLNAHIVTGANNVTLEITKKDAAGQLINQSYSGQLQVYYDGNLQSVVLPLTSGAGSWSWNGTEVMVYAMPFDENIIRLLGVSNQGSYQFDVTAEVHADGLVYGPYSLGPVGPKTVSQFGAVLDQAISDSGDQIGSTRANIVLRASVSTANLMVYGGYRVDSDLTLVNLQTSAQSNLVTP